MSSIDRESSRDRDMVLKHQHSFSSESGRSHIPMWDSSDPERAPPPLPLNPGSPVSASTRPNVSAGIAAAARALEEKARESAPASSYTTNRMPEKSPDRSLVKSAQHKRMQSLQTTSVRDLRSFLDGVRSPDRSPERPSRSATPNMGRDHDRDYPFPTSPDKSPTRSGTPTPLGRDVLKDTPALRASSRPLTKAILGENTPPSATMLALQTMTIPREHLEPLPNIANSTNSTNSANSANSANTSTARTPQTFDAISSQLLSITSIASNLQKEMSQLSRRSKDNASDLISLKEATNSRDEDIRKCLRELVANVGHPQQSSLLGAPLDFSRSSSGLFGEKKDSHSTPPGKNFVLPRFPSPNMWGDDRIGSPNPYSVEGAASVAMLEKIIREMVTKDGQERLLATLSTLVDKATGDTAKKVTDLVEFIKTGPQSQALVARGGGNGGGVNGQNTTFQPTPGTGPLARTTRDMNASFPMPNGTDSQKAYASPKAADFVSEEMLKYLKKIKDSVAETGGMTAETKAFLKTMRGEVLGMGRDIARQIDEYAKERESHLAIDDVQNKPDLERIVQEGLGELRGQMDRLIREKRRQSNSSMMSRNSVDSQEVYQVVKQALAERGLDRAPVTADSSLDKEAILSAVREAYEAYKPEIELQQFGLERDEILQCLKEGLEDYRNSNSTRDQDAISREEVMDTIHEAFQNFTLPAPPNEAHEIREEVLCAVRECLEEFKPAMNAQPPSFDHAVTRELVAGAVKDTLANHDFNAPRELEISREDLFDAVKAGLEGSSTPMGGYGEQVMTSLKEVVNNMREEFKSYSSANGRDTEQVLDAVRDGLETLRAEIETYVDKAQDVTGKDEIVDTMRDELERLRTDVQGFVAEGPRGDHALSRGDMIGYIKSEFEHLHEELTSQFLPAAKDKEEILTALTAGFESMRSQVTTTRDFDPETNDDINEAMKDEFEQLKDVLLGGSASHKDEILEALHASLEGLHANLGQSDSSVNTNDDILASMKEEFEHLRETLATTLIKSGGSADRDDIVDAVRESMDGLRSQLASEQDTASKETLTAIQEEVQHLRETLGSTLVRSGDSVEKEEILETLRTGLEEMRANASRSESSGLNEELLEAFRGELEQLRQSIATGMARHGSRADTEEVLDAVRLGLDDLRSHLEKRMDNPERHMSATGEILDALNDGLDSLRSDVVKLVDKPVDMTVSYEILDTLKDGLAGLREDIDRLKGHTRSESSAESFDEEAPRGNEVVLAEDPGSMSRDMPPVHVPQESLQRNDLEKMEVMLAQLNIKVEAMDANIQNTPAPTVVPEAQPASGSAMKDDMIGIEALLQDLQATVNVIASRDGPNPDGLATKDDTDAIETLLRNTKAVIEELPLADSENAMKKEHLDAIEGITLSTNEAIDALATKIDENGATKEDIAVVEVLVQDMKIALEELKLAKPEEEEGEEKLTKTDVDTLALICMDIKAKVEEMNTPDADQLPSKADVEQLTGLVHDFRDSHDKMKDSYEADIAITAKAFDDRKKEAEDMVLNIAEVKTVLDEIKEDIKSNLREGGQGVDGLLESFKSLEETIGSNFNITADIKELMETVNREFDRSHGSVEGLKVDQDEKLASTLEKQEEAKEAIIAELCQKLDEKFDTIMTKYDDAQLLADEQAKVMNEKATEQQEILANTKAMADELRLTIDTLGATITGLSDTFSEVTNKMAQDSQTVFGRMDDTVAKLDDHHVETKSEHQHTRDEVANAIRIINGLQGDVTEFHPKFMVTLREILALVNQHYEHSQKAKESTEEQVRAIAEENNARAEEIRSNFTNLPALLPPPPPAVEPVERYDDGQVQEKLDKLLNHADESEKSIAQLSRLDQIHQQVMNTAAEVSDFVAKQTQLITDGHESKEREAEEMALLVERRLAQKEQLDSDVQNLKDEKDSLLAIVAALQVERENLATQKVRLTGEVSSLQTALDIRREELRDMDHKADALERRILNGIMDHSRALLINKTNKSPGKPKKQRMPSNASHSTLGSMPPPSAAANGLSLALKQRPAIRRNGPPPNPASRRILSLSQITNNVPTGAQAYAGAPNSLSNGLGNLKRSHSVKTNYMRKTSWNGRPGGRRVSEINKENEALAERDENENESEGEIDNDDTPRKITAGPAGDVEHEDEHEREDEHEGDEDLASDAGTERRHSYATATGSYADGFDGRSSYGAGDSEYTYGSGTGSYMTGSDLDRRTSYGSTVRSTLMGGAIDEEGEEEESGDEQGHHGQEHEISEEEAEKEDHLEELKEVGGHGDEGRKMIVFAAPSDSGLGTDLPTGVEMSEADYFRRAAEEESTVG
ncbi:hypothetical protein BU16DRAFT_581917 [Lophium mytilinum]|uniref:Chromosome segregation ATPase family protein n=1 Tax=Lophium mytilinum TaxID=390894 RepID=A0A6A6QSM5_9PEZI|nr:hypothetical protein BU16DRAFT_581917 [Lophium mytilinum]